MNVRGRHRSVCKLSRNTPSRRSADDADGSTRAYRSTDNFVEIGSLSPAVSTAAGSLDKLTGKPVVIEGIFHARLLNKVPQKPGVVFSCVGDCRTSGVLENITRVSAQP